MSDKKTVRIEKLLTNEICGIDGTAVEICGLTTQGGGGISITGENVMVSGGNDSIVDVESGVFDTISIGGVDYVPRGQIAYAFRFGGPPTNVPTRLPRVVDSDSSMNITGYTGLHAGTNLVFVNDSSSFEKGDHILVGGLHDKDATQETHTITDVSYYRPSTCCQAKLTASFVAGVSTITHYDVNHTGYAFQVGDKVKLGGGDNTIYSVTESDISTADSRYIHISPTLQDPVSNGDCLCMVVPTLETESNLVNTFPTGTEIANKFARTVTKDFYDLSAGDPHWASVELLINSGVSDASIKDYSVNDHLVTTNNGILGTTDEKRFSSSLSFDGVDDNLEVTGSVVNFSSNNFTIDCWFKRTSIDKREFLFGSSDQAIHSTVALELGTGYWKNHRSATVDDSGKLIAHFNYGFDGVNPTVTSHYSLIIGDTMITDAKWHHVAVTRDGINLSLYVDGVKEGTAYSGLSTLDLSRNLDSALPSTTIALNDISTSQYSGPRPLTIGGTKLTSDASNSFYLPFKGYIEDFRITDTVRYHNNFISPVGSASTSLKTEDLSCADVCYDSKYLYVEQAMYANNVFEWNLTGYREGMVSFSGIEFNITGQNTSGLFTMVYPNI